MCENIHNTTDILWNVLNCASLYNFYIIFIHCVYTRTYHTVRYRYTKICYRSKNHENFKYMNLYCEHKGVVLEFQSHNSIHAKCKIVMRK